jgi:DNA repair protein RadC
MNAREVVATYKKGAQIETKKVSGSEDAYSYLRAIYRDDIELRESFYSLFLDRNNTIIGYTLIGVGGLSACVADAKLVFQGALICNASSVIIAHNHPSGNLAPSNADLVLTEKINQIGKLLDLPLLDHLILTPENGYYSFADSGKLQ